jgi:hypothetical protein
MSMATAERPRIRVPAVMQAMRSQLLAASGLTTPQTPGTTMENGPGGTGSAATITVTPEQLAAMVAQGVADAAASAQPKPKAAAKGKSKAKSSKKAKAGDDEEGDEEDDPDDDDAEGDDESDEAESAGARGANARVIRARERSRMAAIMSCEAAAANPALALHFATKTTMSRGAAIAALAATPGAPSGMAPAGIAGRMAQHVNLPAAKPGEAAGAPTQQAIDQSWDRAMAKTQPRRR